MVISMILNSDLSQGLVNLRFVVTSFSTITQSSIYRIHWFFQGSNSLVHRHSQFLDCAVTWTSGVQRVFTFRQHGSHSILRICPFFVRFMTFLRCLRVVHCFEDYDSRFVVKNSFFYTHFQARHHSYIVTRRVIRLNVHRSKSKVFSAMSNRCRNNATNGTRSHRRITHFMTRRVACHGLQIRTRAIPGRHRTFRGRAFTVLQHFQARRRDQIFPRQNVYHPHDQSSNTRRHSDGKGRYVKRMMNGLCKERAMRKSVNVGSSHERGVMSNRRAR